MILSIDIESTGTESDKDQILQFAAIIEDPKEPKSFVDCPKFNAFVRHPKYYGDAFALAMNGWILSILDNPELLHKTEQYENEYRFVTDFYLVAKEFRDWLMRFDYFSSQVKDKNKDLIYLTVAGKNAGTFDLRFLELLPGWKKYFKVRSRIIDPALYYSDLAEDSTPVGLSQCKQKAGIVNTDVKHDALWDAYDVILLLRPFYNGSPIDLLNKSKRK